MWKADAKQADEALHRLDAAGMSKARGAAQAALDALMLTEAPLLYSPSLVALAALTTFTESAQAYLTSSRLTLAPSEPGPAWLHEQNHQKPATPLEDNTAQQCSQVLSCLSNCNEVR